jgi:hypothetical protein
MELDGYLTGIVARVCSFPADGFHPIWGDNEPTFDTLNQMQTVIGAVMSHSNAISAALDEGFKQRSRKERCLSPAILLAVSGKLNRDVVRTGVRGFVKAMALAPER